LRITKTGAGKPRKCVEKKKPHDPKMLEGMEEAIKGNETRKFYIIGHWIKAGFQRKMSVCKSRDNNVIGSDQSIMERWKK